MLNSKDSMILKSGRCGRGVRSADSAHHTRDSEAVSLYLTVATLLSNFCKFTVHCYVSSVCGDGVRGSLLRTSWERGSASEAAHKRSKINVFSPHLLTGGHQIQ